VAALESAFCVLAQLFLILKYSDSPGKDLRWINSRMPNKNKTVPKFMALGRHIDGEKDG
jgi:hypothetical protein